MVMLAEHSNGHPQPQQDEPPEPLKVLSGDGFELYDSDAGYIVIKQEKMMADDAEILLTPAEAVLLRRHLGRFIKSAKKSYSPVVKQ